MIEEVQRRLLLYLQSNPLAKYTQIGHEFGVTAQTAKNWVEKLISNDPPLITSISAQINPSALGMKLHTYFINLHNLSPNNSYEQLRRIGNTHPYTTFQNRYFGKENGVLMQFFLPEELQDELNRLFEFTSSKLNITSLDHFFRQTLEIESFPNIERYHDGEWIFSFDDWYDKEDSLAAVQYDTSTANQLERMTDTELIMVRELMINSRRSQSQIMKDIRENGLYSDTEKEEFSDAKQRQFSRRMSFIEDSNIISGHRLLFNRSSFKIFNQILVTGSLHSEDRSRFISLLQTDKLPFRSLFRLYDDNRYTFWINLPPNQTSECINFMFKISREFHLYFLDTIPYHNVSYPLWHRNLRDGRWIMNASYLVDDVIEELDLF